MREELGLFLKVGYLYLPSALGPASYKALIALGPQLPGDHQRPVPSGRGGVGGREREREIGA